MAARRTTESARPLRNYDRYQSMYSIPVIFSGWPSTDPVPLSLFSSGSSIKECRGRRIPEATQCIFQHRCRGEFKKTKMRAKQPLQALGGLHPSIHTSIHPFTHTGSLVYGAWVHGFTDSLVHWFIDSLIQNSLNHWSWYTNSLIHGLTHSLSH